MTPAVRAALSCVIAMVLWIHATPASAVHLFPLVPGDPTGDCAAKLRADPGAGARVTLEGFFFFDETSRTYPAVTTIKVGRSVTWEWVRFCHSVTSTSVPKGAKKFTTYGGKGSAKGPPAGQDQLMKPSGDKNTFTVKFIVPGSYRYACVHHASVGMTGTVVVKK